MDTSFANCDLFREPVRPSNITTENISLYVSSMNNYAKVNDSDRNPEPVHGMMFHENQTGHQSQTKVPGQRPSLNTSQNNPTNIPQSSTIKPGQNPLQQRYPWRKGKWSGEEEVF